MTTAKRVAALRRASARIYTFKILDRQLDALRRIQTARGTAVSEQIRRGVDLWLERQQEQVS